MWKTAPELRILILSGYKVTTDDLSQLINIARSEKETLYLEFKHADILNKREKPEIIRRYTSGFANSDGGIFIIGVDESNDWGITSCPPNIGGTDLAQWASDCNSPIAHLFSPPPNYQILKHPEGIVLFITVGRSVNLIYYPEKGENAFFLRHHDKTLKTPDYLLADLLGGRRARPYLDLTAINLRNINVKLDERFHQHQLGFEVELDIENHGFVWAKNVRVHMIFFELGSKTINFSSDILSYLFIQNDLAAGVNLRQKIKDASTIVPFVLKKVNYYSLTIPFSFKFRRPEDFVWKCSFVLYAEDTPPVWYQVTLLINSEVRDILDYSSSTALHWSSEENDFLTLERVFDGKKATVSFDRLNSKH